MRPHAGKEPPTGGFFFYNRGMNRGMVLGGIVGLLLLAGPALGADWPVWAMNPTFDGGIAAADCTQASGNLTLDRSMVVANARTTLAQEISVRVKAVDKVYASRLQQGDRRPESATLFLRASESITDQALQNSRVARFETIRRTFGPNLVCALVVMGPKETREYFTDLVRVAQAQVAPQVESELFDTFRGRRVEK